MVALLALASGCATVRAECELHGGSPWREVRSRHFRLYTDASPEAAHQTAVRLEKLRRALLLPFGTQVDPPGVLEVFLFRSHGEYAELADPESGGMVVWGTPPLMLLPAAEAGEPTVTSTVSHEVMHYLSRYVLLRQPRWLAEGIATDMETVELTPDETQVHIGKVPEFARTSGVDVQYLLPLEQLWGWDEDGRRGEHRRQSYYSSWAWTVFLRNRHPQQLADFYGRLARAEEPRLAWGAAFRGVAPAALDAEMRAYFDKGISYYSTYALPPVDTRVTEGATLAPAQVHALRARLVMLGLRERPAAERERLTRAEVAQALALDPHNVEARLLELRLGGSRDALLARARALTAQAPDNAEAWHALSHALGDDKEGAAAHVAELEQALLRAAALAPDHPDVLNELAWYHVTRGQPERALGPAQRAVALAPWDAAILDTWAAALAAQGRCTEAVRVQQRALDALHERVSEETRTKYRAPLERYRAGCKPASARP